MDPIFPQRGQIAPAPAAIGTPGTGGTRAGLSAVPLPASVPPAAWPRDRLDRLAVLTPEDKTAGLVWLAIHFPAVCDAVLDTVEQDDGDDVSAEPEPYCAVCGADIGIFLRYGLDWRHFRGTIGQIELFDAGHTPVVAWRPAPVITAR